MGRKAWLSKGRKMTFREKWLNVVERKNSVLCAGLDPPEFEMGRGEKGLPKGVDKLEWSLRYIDAVAPYCAALKPNLQYWKGDKDLMNLAPIIDYAKQNDLLLIDDSKLADIGSTNGAGVFYSDMRSFDAVTLALFAGNMEEAANQLKERDLGGIHMCIMSNPEYGREKNKLVDVGSEFNEYRLSETVGTHAFQYAQLAHDAKKFGLDGVVIGAPSGTNHISNEEVEAVRHYVGSEMLVLLPGVGAQGGEAGSIWKYFDKNNVIVNVGRSLMFPEGSNSNIADQANAAEHYRDMLNNLRAA